MEGECILRYDPEDRLLFFSTQIAPSEDETAASFEHFNSYKKECLDNPGKWFRGMMKTPDGEPDKVKIVLGFILSVALFGGVFATVLCLPVKKYDLIPWIVSGVFLLFGGAWIFGASIKENGGFGESVFCQRIEGIICILGAAGLIVINYAFPRDVMMSFVLAVFCEISFVLFLLMTVATIGYYNANNSIYTEEVKAICIGYVRTYEAVNAAEGLGCDYIPYNSPVFEYYYGGEKYQSIYDLLDEGVNGKIEVGSTNVIRISPEVPTRVLGDNKKHANKPLVFAVLSFVAFAVLLTLILF